MGHIETSLTQLYGPEHEMSPEELEELGIVLGTEEEDMGDIEF